MAKKKQSKPFCDLSAGSWFEKGEVFSIGAEKADVHFSWETPFTSKFDKEIAAAISAAKKAEQLAADQQWANLPATQQQAVEEESLWWKSIKGWAPPLPSTFIGSSYKDYNKYKFVEWGQSDTHVGLSVKARFSGKPILFDTEVQAPPCYIDVISVTLDKAIMKEWKRLTEDELSRTIPLSWLPTMIERMTYLSCSKPSASLWNKLDTMPPFGSDGYFFWSSSNYQARRMRLTYQLAWQRDIYGLPLYKLVHDYDDF